MRRIYKMPKHSKTKSATILKKLNHYLEKLVQFLAPGKVFFAFASYIISIALCFFLAFWIRFEFQINKEHWEGFKMVLPLAIFLKLIPFVALKLYKGMWRYVSISDLIKIIIANVLSTTALVILVLTFWGTFNGFPRSVLLLDFIFCCLLLPGKRVLTRVIREMAEEENQEIRTKTLIVGDLKNINLTLQSLQQVKTMSIVGLINNEEKKGWTIRNAKILGPFRKIGRVAAKYNIKEILLIPPYTTPNNLKEVLDLCEQSNVSPKLKQIPSLKDIADGHINISHIKDVEFTDLLGRPQVELNRSEVKQQIENQNIFVTGGGGSIGSELCRQISTYNPKKLVIFESSEFNLYSIHKELINSYPLLEIIPVMGDIKNYNSIEDSMLEHKIDVVYHAAAYKHVPMMEWNVKSAFSNNVLGSFNVAKACKKTDVKTMVTISSDKAVRPTSIMGATKRLTERIIIESSEKSQTKFKAVRFGNVLGSSGSVIPLFKKQIADGGPVTVTTPEMTRYFMSIPEAVDLVLEAGAVGNDRDIMVLEMGSPVKIVHMAKKLIELSGLVPDTDIKIEFTGMRPGEKEYEELITNDEDVTKTQYNRIFVAKKKSTEQQAPTVSIEEIQNLLKDSNAEEKLRKFAADHIDGHMLNQS